MGRGTDAAVTEAQSVFTTEGGGAGARSCTGRKGWGVGQRGSGEGKIINGGLTQKTFLVKL